MTLAVDAASAVATSGLSEGRDENLEELFASLEDALGLSRAPQPTTNEPSASPPSLLRHASGSDAKPIHSGTLPYQAYRANRRRHESMNLIRGLFQSGTELAWKVRGEATVPGIKSKNSIDTEALPEVDTEVLRKKWTFLPHWLKASVSPTGCASFPERIDFDGPRWKSVGAEERQPYATRELILGLRIASVLVGDDPLTADSWLHGRPRGEVGFLSLSLTGDAAKRFLESSGGSPATALRRGLLRSLATSGGDPAMVCAWTTPVADSGDITLFFALRSNDRRGVMDAIEVDRGRRYIETLERHGVRILNGMPHQGDLANFYAQVPNSPTTDYLDQPPFGGDFREFTPASGFASVDEIRARHDKAANVWFRHLDRFRCPHWMSVHAWSQLQDYLLRSPEHVFARAQIIARMKKKSASPSDRRALERLRSIELGEPRLKLFWGSPAQFAAHVMASGDLLGSYCDSRHKAGRVAELFEDLRRGVELEGAPA